jgi:hypothetical protein
MPWSPVVMSGQARPGLGSEALRRKNLPHWAAFVPSPRIGRSEERPSLDGLWGRRGRMRGRPHRSPHSPLTLPSPRKRGEGHAFPGHDAPGANTGPHLDPTRSTNSERYKRENRGSYSTSCWQLVLGVALDPSLVVAGLVPAIHAPPTPRRVGHSPSGRKACKNNALCAPCFRALTLTC